MSSHSENANAVLLGGKLLKVWQAYGFDAGTTSHDGRMQTGITFCDGFQDYTVKPDWMSWKLQEPRMAEYVLVKGNERIPLTLEERANDWIMLHTPTDFVVGGGDIHFAVEGRFLVTERNIEDGKRYKSEITFDVVRGILQNPRDGAIGALGVNAPGNTHRVGPQMVLYVHWGARDENMQPVCTGLTVHCKLTSYPWD